MPTCPGNAISAITAPSAISVLKRKMRRWRSRRDLGDFGNNKPFYDTVPGCDPELQRVTRAGYLKICQALQVRADLPRQFHPLLT